MYVTLAQLQLQLANYAHQHDTSVARIQRRNAIGGTGTHKRLYCVSLLVAALIIFVSMFFCLFLKHYISECTYERLLRCNPRNYPSVKVLMYLGACETP